MTNHSKKPITSPIKENHFLAHVQVDLVDFRNLPCECQSRLKWGILHINIMDHFSNYYSWLLALKNKLTEEAAQALTSLWMFGFLSILHSDNGREFKSNIKTMGKLCKNHKIRKVHSAP